MIATVAALGGLGGLAVFLPAVGDMFGWGGDAPRPKQTVVAAGPSRASTAVRIEYPAARGDEQVEIGLCQEFKGTSRLADSYRLWIAGRAATDDDYVLFGEATVSATTGKWTHTLQVGAEEQKGMVFEIFAVPVPQTMSDYLLNATDYQGRHLAPHGDGTTELGLRNTALPPGSDTRHSDSVKVRRSGEPGAC